MPCQAELQTRLVDGGARLKIVHTSQNQIDWRKADDQTRKTPFFLCVNTWFAFDSASVLQSVQENLKVLHCAHIRGMNFEADVRVDLAQRVARRLRLELTN